ncbi:MAG: DUF3798 domain-containing protein [Tissierellia bacterium]|nr:DUF3798 domain-containing protein [Tissierellia bacterium]
MKKHISLLLAIIMMFTLVACGKKEEAAQPKEEDVAKVEEPAGEDKEETEEPAGEMEGYKIGIMTGTVSQGEEEYRAGEKLVNDYGDRVIHVTYPDTFSKEPETTISNIKSMAADPEVKAIIVCQAVNGVTPAFEEVRAMRDDILLIAGAPHEDPDIIAGAADLSLDINQLMRGEAIAQTAKDMGAETFVHYSFPRHMQMELLAARRTQLKEACEALGITFVEVDAPDPTSDAGTSGTQQFILEDIPRQVAEYGKDTAFFGTNCGMQEAMIKAIVSEGAIYPEQCCPSPYHAYPGALGIPIPEDKAGDIDYLHEQNAAKLAEKGVSGRFGTWVQPANVSIINAGFEYAKDYAEGKAEKNDMDLFQEKMSEVTGVSVEDLKFTEYNNLDGYRLFILDSIIY